MENETTPPDLREGVRAGILSAIERDVERQGGRTAGLLVAAGIGGVTGAIGVTLLVSTHPFGHHPPWHVALFSALWTGLLVVAFAMAFLGLRTPSLPLARAASVGLLGLGLAGICGLACPDPHFLRWWAGTGVGQALTRAGGLGLSALCFGLVTTLFVALVAAFSLSGPGEPTRVSTLLKAGVLLVLLAPGVALQSYGTSLGVFSTWLAGTAGGAFVGVGGGAAIRARVRAFGSG